jgi:rhamnosyl/mannosyltransferase
MKVMIAAAYFHPRLGGLESYAAAVADGLHARGWDVVVVCSDIRVDKVTREIFNGYTVWRLPIWKVISNTPIHPAWLGIMRRIVRIERPDIINAHTPVPYMVEVATIAAGQIPIIVTYHAASLFKSDGLLMRLLTIAYKTFETLTLKRADAIIAVSPYVKSTLGRYLANKIEVVPNSVAGVSNHCHRGGEGLVFVANLEPSHAWKGLDLILDSLVIARDNYGISPQLTIIGDGTDRARYERRVNDLDLNGSVEFMGAFTGLARDKVLQQAVAQLLYPTTANDGMPTVLLEGWAQGLPAIAADIGPIAEVVNDGETGVLVAPNDPAALAAGIHALLADREKAEAMGEAARQLVEQEFTWPRQVELTAMLFERQSKRTRPASRTAGIFGNKWRLD